VHARERAGRLAGLGFTVAPDERVVARGERGAGEGHGELHGVGARGDGGDVEVGDGRDGRSRADGGVEVHGPRAVRRAQVVAGEAGREVAGTSGVDVDGEGHGRIVDPTGERGVEGHRGVQVEDRMARATAPQFDGREGLETRRARDDRAVDDEIERAVEADRLDQLDDVSGGAPVGQRGEAIEDDELLQRSGARAQHEVDAVEDAGVADVVRAGSHADAPRRNALRRTGAHAAHLDEAERQLAVAVAHAHGRAATAHRREVEGERAVPVPAKRTLDNRGVRRRRRGRR
jgi:hypothetical protein